MSKNDLEDRLINFAVAVISVAEGMSKSYAGNHLADQMTRSSSSSALNYGEAQSAESRRDFIHKIKVVLKELRETIVSLKITERAKLNSNSTLLSKTIQENNELISIFVTSVETARKNLNAK